MTTSNPLLAESALPRFAAIEAEHVQSAVAATLAHYRARIDALVADSAPRTFANTMLPQEMLEQRLERVWSPVSHLHAVKDSESLRAVYGPAEQAISDYTAELGQNRALYAAVKAVADGAEFSTLPRAARTLV